MIHDVPPEPDTNGQTIADRVGETARYERALLIAFVADWSICYGLEAAGECPAVAECIDPAAVAVYTAARNLDAASIPVDLTSVLAELERTCGRGSNAAGVDWLKRGVEAYSPAHPIYPLALSWARAIKTGCADRAAELRLSDAGLRVIPLPVPQPPPSRWLRRSQIARAIMDLAAEPWIALRLGGDELVVVRPGGMALLIGASGSGKTSLAMCLAIEHAISAGPAIVLSLELPGDEAGARGIGSRRELTWPAVLRGELDYDDMVAALPERLYVIDREHATLDVLDAAVAAARAEYPRQPVLVVIDYVQLVRLPDGPDLRVQLTRIVREITARARAQRYCLLAISQSSRAGARALASGERLGAETTDAGAESAELERWATVTIALGKLGDGDDGSPAEISIGKARMGQGDVVIPARYWGATGRWRLTGPPQRAQELRAERAADNQEAEVARTAWAIRSALADSPGPLSRSQLAKLLHVRKGLVLAAVLQLLADEHSDVVECGAKTGGWYPVWIRSLAESKVGLYIHEPGGSA